MAAARDSSYNNNVTEGMMADLDFGLGEMADTIRETTRRFAADRIAPLAARIDAEALLTSSTATTCSR